MAVEIYRRNPNRIGPTPRPRVWTWERYVAFWRRADRIEAYLESLSPTGRQLMEAVSAARQAILLELVAAGVPADRAQERMLALDQALDAYQAHLAVRASVQGMLEGVRRQAQTFVGPSPN